jgi:hypothetical protein
MSFPPTVDNPLLIATPEGRVISCAVRTLRRRPASPRWVFVTALCNSNGVLDPTTFVGPSYVPGDHDTIDAIRALAYRWWRTQVAVERSHDDFTRWFGSKPLRYAAYPGDFESTSV